MAHVQLGRYPAPTHTLIHLSDTHLLAGGRPLYGALDTDATLETGLAQLIESGQRPAAIVVTGDLADLGEPDAYRRLRSIVDPAAERMGTRMIWVMGNHDERPAFAELMRDAEPSEEPQTAVHDIDGLRIVVLDSSVPGYHHGDLDRDQLAWLRGVLAEPAPHGTLLALHHPPLPSPVELMAILELRHQDDLAEAIRGTDVRGILAGHLHYATHGTFAGVPVSVAGATCYSLDPLAPRGALRGVDGGQSADLVLVHADGITHSTAPIGRFPQVSGFPEGLLERLGRMSDVERIEAFSAKRSTADLTALDEP